MGFHAIPALIPVSRAGKIDRHLGRDDFPVLAPGWITGFDAHFKARPNQVDLSLPNTWHWQPQHKSDFQRRQQGFQHRQSWDRILVSELLAAGRVYSVARCQGSEYPAFCAWSLSSPRVNAESRSRKSVHSRSSSETKGVPNGYIHHAWKFYRTRNS